MFKNFLLLNINSKKINRLIFIFIFIISAYLTADIISIFVKKKFEYPPKIKKINADIQIKKKPDFQEYLENLKNTLSFSALNLNAETETNLKWELADLLSKSEAQKEIALLGTILNKNIALAILNFNNHDLIIYQGMNLGDYLVEKITKFKVEFYKKSQNKKIDIFLGINNLQSQDNLSGSEIKSAYLEKTILNKREIAALMESPDKIAQEINFLPVMKDKQPYGISISYIKPGGIFQKIRLQKDDVLININAKSLKSPEDFFQAYQIFNNEEHITIKFDRQGNILNTTFDVR